MYLFMIDQWCLYVYGEKCTWFLFFHLIRSEPGSIQVYDDKVTLYLIRARIKEASDFTLIHMILFYKNECPGLLVQMQNRVHSIGH